MRGEKNAERSERTSKMVVVEKGEKEQEKRDYEVVGSELKLIYNGHKSNSPNKSKEQKQGAKGEKIGDFIA